VDTEQFIASLVSSLAWPVAVVVMVLLFREQLAKLLSGPLKRLKAGPSGLELEFDRIISEVQAQVEPVPDLEPPSESVISELGTIAHISPAAAVMDGYARIEEALRERLRDAGDPRGSERRSAVALARFALEKELITPETAEAVRGAANLRNLTAHGAAADVSEDRAREYLSLVDAILFAIRHGSR
jgi:hypothetical protein